MNEKKRTKKALAMSVLSMVLCVAMLVGMTFAWFTDTASTGVNKIQAGNLDVALEMADGTNADGSNKWVSAEGKTLNFVKATGHESETIFWEPGCTYELPKLRVVNKGKLALKYKVLITGIQGDTGLNKVIDWTIDGVELAKEYNMVAGADAQEFTISGHMQESAGNDYQGLSIDGIAITVIATQLNSEFDSNGNDYDISAEYPVAAAGKVTVDANNKVTDAVTIASADKVTGTTTPVAKAEVPTGATVKETNGQPAQQLELVVTESTKPANLTIATTSDSQTLEVQMKGLDASNTTPIKVSLFVGKGLDGFKLYHHDAEMTKKNAVSDVTQDQEYYYDSESGVVTFMTATFSPFTYAYDKFQWGNKKADSYSTPVDTVNKVITVSSAEELALFKYEVTNKKVNYSGYTLNITSDIDLGAGFWEPINAASNRMAGITIDGQGHTIRNMLVRSSTAYYTGSGYYGFAFIGNMTGAVTIKNLTFDKANVAAAKGYEKGYAGNVGGIVMGYTYGTTVFDNVKVVNSQVYGYGKIGTLLGMGADPGVKVTFKDCVSQGNTISAAYDMGGLAGMIQRGNGVDNARVENCTVKNITVNYYPEGSYVDINDAEATLKSNDKPDGTDITKKVSGKYLEEAGYYWCGYGDYYVSYGNSSYDASVKGFSKCLANSEYGVNQ